ncbi:CDP-diacylglycerol--serine O-phosphatidyltransferase [Microscilla marina]|uniref:CDP-diacylglycerol--serine O-phosphatidyltransferase n=1 Tax=Microscilla marina ATCC 23134 TaxID=313606 RepID=A1ZPC2_MICM2|nr:CDP-diacylglycerol--serine O-phosphatidyltransferase [Microscilla marina]EAY27661.1 CDP-diacylglycerol--serine O-phosphatidyltransferase [Microscilla marina ATCC 23134]
MKQHIPNMITCGNVLCGCVGIVAASQGKLIEAVYFILAGMVFDFADGLAARLLRAYSDIGKQLDSLADMVTFGVLPGMVLFQLLAQNEPKWAAYGGFLLTIFSALRLAKFNIDTRQTDSFIGLPTPSAALFVGSLPLIIHQQPAYKTFIEQPVTLFAVTIFLSFLLVAELPLFSLKFKNFGWADNKIRYIFMFLSVLLFVLFKFLAIPFILLMYVLLSFLSSVTKAKVKA